MELGLEKPEFRQDENFTVVLWRKETSGKDNEGANGYANGYVNGEVNGYANEGAYRYANALTYSQQLVFNVVHDNPGINTKQIAEVLNKSPRTIEKHIAFLAKASLIEHRDSDKTGGYYVK